MQSRPKQIWLQDKVSGKTETVTGGDCNSSSPAWEEGSRTLIFASDCGGLLSTFLKHARHI
jgi:Tol biopolymer transport system component